MAAIQFPEILTCGKTHNIYISTLMILSDAFLICLFVTLFRLVYSWAFTLMDMKAADDILKQFVLSFYS